MVFGLPTDNGFSTEKTTNLVKISTTSLGLTNSTSPVLKTGFKENSLFIERVDRQVKIYYILIGCCCVMVFALIVMLFVYRKRYIFSMRPFTSQTV